jgi:hypothetical protein
MSPMQAERMHLTMLGFCEVEWPGVKISRHLLPLIREWLDVIDLAACSCLLAASYYSTTWIGAW